MLQFFDRLFSVEPIQSHVFFSTLFRRKAGLSRQLWLGLLDGKIDGSKDGSEDSFIDGEKDGFEDIFVEGLALADNEG